MKIEFCCGTEKIPTGLRLLVDDKIHVDYKRLNSTFGYEFKIYGAENNEQAMSIVKEIASIMEHQSYDHGSEWRRTGIDIMHEGNKEWYEPCVIWVHFRVKDSY